LVVTGPLLLELVVVVAEVQAPPAEVQEILHAGVLTVVVIQDQLSD
jgi:hypothetical protein